MPVSQHGLMNADVRRRARSEKGVLASYAPVTPPGTYRVDVFRSEKSVPVIVTTACHSAVARSTAYLARSSQDQKDRNLGL
jgi:hypothetical protein